MLWERKGSQKHSILLVDHSEELLIQEYPETDMSEATIVNLTKKEMLNWIKKFYDK